MSLASAPLNYPLSGIESFSLQTKRSNV